MGKKIQSYLKDSKTLKDIGCCVGFFCHKAAESLNMHTIGIDNNDQFLRIARYTKQYVINGENESFYNMTMDKNNVETLPQTDATIFFTLASLGFSLWFRNCYSNVKNCMV